VAALFAEDLVVNTPGNQVARRGFFKAGRMNYDVSAWRACVVGGLALGTGFSIDPAALGVERTRPLTEFVLDTHHVDVRLCVVTYPDSRA
jgi:hypothetical protein